MDQRVLRIFREKFLNIHFQLSVEYGRSEKSGEFLAFSTFLSFSKFEEASCETSFLIRIFNGKRNSAQHFVSHPYFCTRVTAFVCACDTRTLPRDRTLTLPSSRSRNPSKQTKPLKYKDPCVPYIDIVTPYIFQLLNKYIYIPKREKKKEKK